MLHRLNSNDSPQFRETDMNLQLLAASVCTASMLLGGASGCATSEPSTDTAAAGTVAPRPVAPAAENDAALNDVARCRSVTRTPATMQRTTSSWGMPRPARSPATASTRHR